MDEWWRGVAEDFSDVPDMAQVIRLTIRLLLAALLGGVLGFERERAGKAAGLRTHMLVSLGSALFVLIPEQAAMSSADLSRVIQGIVSGIGFIGAGAILKQATQEEVKGLTTAAGLWLTAAVGVAAGLGRETSAVLGALLALFILSVLQRAEKWLNKSSREVPTGDDSGEAHRGKPAKATEKKGP